MKKIIALAAILFAFAGNLSAFTELDQLLINEATTPDLKKIAKDYFAKKAKDHKELAEKYKSLANQSHGGKAVADEADKKKYNKLAEHCEKEAAAYKAQADKY
ncbi:hypothetical protein ACE5IS_12775 [Leptospira wolffii]|uniref:Uncharacterized protein n=1 Tax=Leptospira wolffii TaxID=409998 RepID=A0A2M9Z9P3_9LEPT|nr:hypothetical protein [Leptospira wolffii]EPG67379.1 hypothetical protein LEP1GSC061_1989 [Leptospira wolffii serovar Khorat str. Khorat-H2]PJZ65145.1 hypothetical protein CH371_14575 [Leptospira wolffii]TGK56730.1 hypothetical protein EHQ32_14155 [Leptospira wolffii]TGK71688.1 hypothetical protein EHQ27_10375 [Leptospira wolffii]TGK75455.1 hypothetical protein EHQ35_03530 [Leptospira wolffii]